MNTFTGKLDQLEAKLQTFIESKLSRLSARGNYERLARQLVASMRAGTISSGDGVLLAPDQFIILTHPVQIEYLNAHPELLIALANLIAEVGKKAGLHFGQHPAVTTARNEDGLHHQTDIIARISDKALGNTANLNPETTQNIPVMPLNAFLIFNGTEVFPLEQAVFNIGRRSSNHLSIEDPRVSRQHAQIRATQGRYEIFDLDSTGGTFINQKRITRGLLHPGDVISLAGVHLIYGQERSAAVGNTKKFPSSDKLNQPVPDSQP